MMKTRKLWLRLCLLWFTALLLAPLKGVAATTASLSIEPLSIKAGETKEMVISLTNPDDQITLVQFDLQLPAGLQLLSAAGETDADIAGRTTYQKHSLSTRDHGSYTRFLLSSTSNATLTGTSGAIVKMKVVADGSFTAGVATLSNILLVTPNQDTIEPEAFMLNIGQELLSVEQPLSIEPGTTRTVQINLTNPDLAITLVQFDLQLPAGLHFVTTNGEVEAGIAGRTTTQKHSLSIRTSDDATRFLLSSTTNDVLTGTQGAIITVSMAADESFTGGMATLKNILAVSPNKDEVMVSSYVFAVDIFSDIFTVGGVTYKVMDRTARTCQVGDGTNSAIDKATKGALSIPAIVNGYKVAAVASSAFANCTALTSVSLPVGVTSIDTKGFYWCTALTSVSLPEGLTSIANQAFYYDRSLTAISLPSTLTSIGENAFYNCRTITTLSLPERLTTLGKRAFRSCSGLKTVIAPWATPPAATELFYSASQPVVYIPANSRAAYASTAGWKDLTQVLEMADIAPGTYYLQQVETGKFLNKLISWDTHAVLGERSLPINFSKMDDGSYTIDFIAGSFNRRQLFRADESSVYVDYDGQLAGCPYWTITQAADGTYRIQSLISHDTYGQAAMPGTFLGNDTTVVYTGTNMKNYTNNVTGNVTDSEGTNIAWSILSMDDYWRPTVTAEIERVISFAKPIGANTAEAEAFIARDDTSMDEMDAMLSNVMDGYAKALKENTKARMLPLDVSGLIVNASFSYNDSTYWNTLPSPLFENYGNAEYYQRSFNIFQKVEGIPNGTYLLKVKAFQRPGEMSRVLPTDTTWARLYANDASQTLKNIWTDAPNEPYAYKEKNIGLQDTNTGIISYLPDNMREAHICFEQGRYENELQVQVTDGTLTFGIRSDHTTSYDWVCFDDFSLTLLKLEGSDILMGDVNDDKVVSVTDVGCTINYILEQIPDVFVFEAADMNNDTLITVTDAGLIINKILADESEARPLAVLPPFNSSLGLSQTGGGYQLCVGCQQRFVGCQFDVVLAEGMTLDAVSLDKNRQPDHRAMFRQVAPSRYRVVCYSPDNSPFQEGGGQALFSLTTTGMGGMTIENARFTTTALGEMLLDGVSWATTSIEVATQDIDFEVRGRVLRITSDADTTVPVYATSGLLKSRLSVKPGLNEYSLQIPGVYIINNHKIIVR